MNLVKTHRIRVQTCSRKSADFVWKRPSRSFSLRGLTNKQDKYISLVPKNARQNKPGSRNFSLRDLTKKIRQVYDWHKSSARTYWRRRRGGWAVRRRQQAIGGQCLVSILSNVRKEKETKMIGFSYYIMQSYMHTCNKTICSLPIVLYIPPARKRMSRLYRGVHKWRFDFLSWKIANSRICI